MFSITLRDSKVVRNIFEAVSAVIEEANIIFSEDGVFINAMDEGRVCLISLKLSKDDFDEFKCTGSEELGVSIDDLVKILRRSADDSITFKHEDNSNKLEILMKSNKKKKTRKFSLQLIDLGEKSVDTGALEKIEYTSKVTIPIEYLDESIKDADIYAETLTILIDEEKGIIFRAEGQIGENENIYEKDDEGIENLEVSEVGEGTFALQYLKYLVKVQSITDKLFMALSTGTPLKAIFNILTASSITYFLAPRIEEEEEDYDETY
ncbi:MAG: proliferating cell nuclear antigen (pcna) [Promethearchaeota archaeon]